MADPQTLTACAGCGLTLDLAQPHITLVEQLETEQAGIVAVLRSTTVEHRHEGCEAARG